MAEIESDCKKYAQEDEVSAEQIKDYIDQCVQDLVAAQPAGDMEPAEKRSDD
jgi:hypothetical protein